MAIDVFVLDSGLNVVTAKLAILFLCMKLQSGVVESGCDESVRVPFEEIGRAHV